MKGILKKNQVIITALVIMIAVAGYLNFTQDKLEDVTLTGMDSVTTNANGQQEANSDTDKKNPDNTTASPDHADTINQPENVKDEAQVGNITYDSDGNEILSVAQEGEDLLDLSAEDLGEDDQNTNLASKDSDDEVSDASEDNVGEAVLVSNMIKADYFATAKLEREQNRAKSKETLMEIVDNSAISEEQKKSAIDAVIQMTALAEKESAAEMLLEAKGFTDVVVRVVDQNVDVIVNAKNLTEQQMAQIEDIVKKQTGMAAECIAITPVEVE